MRFYATLFVFPLLFVGSFTQAHERPIVRHLELEEGSEVLPAGPANKSDLDISPEVSAINQLAQNHGVVLSNEQISYVGDILLAYHDGEATRRNGDHPNIIWVLPTASKRREMVQAIQFVIEYFDPVRDVEHMRLQHYMMLEPALFNQKLKEQGKHFAIMDDMAEFHAMADAHGMQVVAGGVNAQERANEYAEAIMVHPPKNMTYFVIDENGMVFHALSSEFRSLITPVVPDRYMRTVCEDRLYRIQ